MKKTTKDNLKFDLGLVAYITLCSIAVPYAITKYAQHADKNNVTVKEVFPPKIETYAAPVIADFMQRHK